MVLALILGVPGILACLAMGGILIRVLLGIRIAVSTWARHRSLVHMMAQIVLAAIAIGREWVAHSLVIHLLAICDLIIHPLTRRFLAAHRIAALPIAVVSICRIIRPISKAVI